MTSRIPSTLLIERLTPVDRVITGVGAGFLFLGGGVMMLPSKGSWQAAIVTKTRPDTEQAFLRFGA